MRSSLFLPALLLPALVSCASEAPSDRPPLAERAAEEGAAGEGAAGEGAAGEGATSSEAADSRQPQPGVGDVPHATHPQVLACFPEALQRSLFEADSLELMGIICERDPDPGEESLRDEYPIRSKVALNTPALRARVLGALYEGLTHGGLLAMCFEPHHAIVATQGEERWEILICYACYQITLQHGETSLGGAAIGEPGAEVLNEVLGQVGNVPAGEIDGRPYAHWLGRLKALAADEAGEGDEGDADEGDADEGDADDADADEGEGDADEGDADEVWGTIQALLVGQPLSAQRADELLGYQARRFSSAPLEVVEFLQTLIQTGRHKPARLAALTLLLKLAQKQPTDPEVALRFVDSGRALLEVLRERLPGEAGYDQAPSTATSPEIREVARKTLRALTWADALRLETWIEETEGDGPLTQERLLRLLKPMLEKKRE